jgi:hypothetical protein
MLLLVATTLSSCGGLMRASTLPAPVSPEMARVYFIFPTHRVMGFGAGAAYITEETKMVGFISNRQAFKVDVAPGKHLFMAIMSNTDAVEVDAAPGRTYYIQVSSAPNPIPYGSPLIILTPLVPGYGQWDMRGEWLNSVNFIEYNEGRGAKWEAKYLDRNQERIEKIRSGEAGLKPMTADQGEGGIVPPPQIAAPAVENTPAPETAPAPETTDTPAE